MNNLVNKFSFIPRFDIILHMQTSYNLHVLICIKMNKLGLEG